ncbi:MAG TPA: hypothetical protein VGP58_11990 [Pyrinomonadaceae bacterium]|nr:hypothetical protein [Pyrinomonadaceae bacterium]
MQSQKARSHLRLYAFCLAQNKAVEENQTIYAFKQDLFRRQIPTQEQCAMLYSHCVISVKIKSFEPGDAPRLVTANL